MDFKQINEARRIFEISLLLRRVKFAEIAIWGFNADWKLNIFLHRCQKELDIHQTGLYIYTGLQHKPCFKKRKGVANEPNR